MSTHGPELALIAPGLPLKFSGGRGLLGAMAMLRGEASGMAIDFTAGGGLGQVAVKGHTTNLNNAPVDQFLTQSGTSPKLVLGSDGLYHWSPHNLFVNSTSAPATQSVALVIGATYTYGVTGSGSLAGSNGASGTATATGSVTFVATTATGTFTKTGTLATMWINRGAVQATPYLASGATPWFGVPIEYDPVAAAYYALVEPQSTNMCLHAQGFDDPAWLVAAVGKTPDQIAAPDGTVTADLLTAAAGTGARSVLQPVVATAAVYTASVYLELGTARYITFSATSGTLHGGVTVDLQNAGAVTQTSGANYLSSTANIKGGWCRVTVTFNATAASWYPCISFTDVPTFAADGFGRNAGAVSVGTETVYAWGAQFELGSVATSPIPTFAAPIIRSADKLDFAGSAFPYSETAGTWWIEYTLYLAAVNNLVGTSAIDQPLLYQPTGNTVSSYDGASFVQTGNVMAPNAKARTAIGWSGATRSLVLDGGAVATGAYDGSWGAVDFAFGYTRFLNANWMTGRIHRTYFVPNRKTDVDLQAGTAP